MGIVKISEQLHENLRSGSAAFSRSINAQAEHWVRVGMIAEFYPNLCYTDISRILLHAGQTEGGLQELILELDKQFGTESGNLERA